MDGKFGAYQLTISIYHEPVPKLLYSSDNSKDCAYQAYQAAHTFYAKNSEYSPNWGIVPITTKWIVYNLASPDMEVFYVCRR